jgi:hypothetical protein
MLDGPYEICNDCGSIVVNRTIHNASHLQWSKLNDIERGYDCRILTHTKPWTFKIESAAFHKDSQSGRSVADDIRVMGFSVEAKGR